MKYVSTRQSADGTWRVWVRKPGVIKTSKGGCATRDEAESWARQRLDPIDRRQVSSLIGLQKITVGDLIERYITEVMPSREGSDESKKAERNRLLRIYKAPLAKANLSEDLRPLISMWFDKRQNEVRGLTAARELGNLASVFKAAKRHWGIVLIGVNPCHGLAPKDDSVASKAQLWTDDVLRLYLDHCGFDIEAGPGKTLVSELGWLLKALRVTGLRPGTLVATRPEWVDLQKRVVHYPRFVVKNKENYDMPLDSAALEIMTALMKHRGGRGTFFTHTYGALAQTFRQVRHKLVKTNPEAGNVIIYGNRHTWTTENARFFSNHLDFLQYTGRESLKVAKMYFNPDALNQAEALDRARNKATQAAPVDTMVETLKQMLAEQQRAHAAQMQALLTALTANATTQTPAPVAQQPTAHP